MDHTALPCFKFRERGKRIAWQQETIHPLTMTAVLLKKMKTLVLAELCLCVTSLSTKNTNIRKPSNLSMQLLGSIFHRIARISNHLSTLVTYRRHLLLELGALGACLATASPASMTLTQPANPPFLATGLDAYQTKAPYSPCNAYYPIPICLELVRILRKVLDK